MGKRKTNKPKKIQPEPTLRPPIIYNYPSDFMCIGSYAVKDCRYLDNPYLLPVAEKEYIRENLKNEVIQKLTDYIPVEYEETPEGLKCTTRIWVERRLMDGYINIK